MTTSFITPTEATGNALSPREGKRNKKAQALSALLSAGALGLFLEGCDGNTSTSSGRTCYSDPLGNTRVSCDSPVAFYYSTSSPLNVGSDSTSNNVALSIEGASEGEGSSETSAGDTEQGDDAVVLEGSASDDILEGRGGYGADTAGYAESDDLSADTIERSDAEDDALVGLTGNAEANALYGSTGADTIDGAEGADTLQGGTGADTYVFAEGDGADTIIEVVEQDVVNTLRFEGDYEASDFSFVRDSEDGTDLVIVVDTDGDGQAENEVTLDGYFVSETSEETAYSIEIQLDAGEAFVPTLTTT